MSIRQNLIQDIFNRVTEILETISSDVQDEVTQEIVAFVGCCAIRHRTSTDVNLLKIKLGELLVKNQPRELGLLTQSLSEGSSLLTQDELDILHGQLVQHCL